MKAAVRSHLDLLLPDWISVVPSTSPHILSFPDLPGFQIAWSLGCLPPHTCSIWVVYQSGFFREAEPVCIYFKELAHAVASAGKSRICRAGPSRKLRQELMLQSGGRISSSWETSVFALKAFTWLDEAHPPTLSTVSCLKVTTSIKYLQSDA